MLDFQICLCYPLATAGSGARQMHLDPQTADERLNSERNIVSRFSKPIPPKPIPPKSNDQPTQDGKVTEITLGHGGRKEGNKNLPDFLRDTVALLSRAGENQVPLAKEFGMSQPNVSAIENGRTPTSKLVEKKLDEVRDRALDRLMLSMGLIDDEKLSKCKAGELSNIAANMSRVVEKVLPRVVDQGSVVNLIVYKPELRSEKSFRMVEV